MTAQFKRILSRCGKTVTLCPPNGGETVETKAFLQPLRKGVDRQFLPTPQGLTRQEQFLYLGDPDADMAALADGCLLCDGASYEVLSAQKIFLGKEPSHWRAVLKLGEEEET